MHMQHGWRTPRDDSALRLQTLTRIRWLAVAGQLAAVFSVHFLMGYELLLFPCLAFIAASAWLNVFLSLRYPANVRWQGPAVLALLAYDILQLSLLLYLTGGIQNPFAILLAVPVVVSATTQRPGEIVPLFLLAIGSASLLVFFHMPLPWKPGESFELSLVYRAGIWVSITCTMAFTAVYTYRLAAESRNLANALAATELVLQREQFITNLDGLTAAAAHELGTPLATISLVAKEMLREHEAGSPHHEDLLLLRSQAERCREIMRKISSLSSQEDINIATISVPVLMEEVTSPLRELGATIDLVFDGDAPPPVIARNPAILYGLGNLLENAVDYARSHVLFRAAWDAEHLELSIADDGPGYPVDVLERIGEPFLTARNRVRRESGGGLGLGLFIAKALLERNRAELAFGNVEAVTSAGTGAGKGAGTRTGTGPGGARVSVSWLRRDIEIMPDASRKEQEGPGTGASIS